LQDQSSVKELSLIYFIKSPTVCITISTRVKTIWYDSTAYRHLAEPWEGKVDRFTFLSYFV